MQKAVERDEYESGPGDKEAERKELQEIRVVPMGKPGDGKGVLTHTMHMHPRGGQGGGPSHEMRETMDHHSSMGSLHSHMTKHFKEHFEPTDEKETDGYEHEPGTEAE